MPIINIFLWTTIFLLVLLSLQLVSSLHRTENSIIRKAVKSFRSSQYAERQSPDKVKFIKRQDANAFWTVGQPVSSSESSRISYYIPAAQSAAASNQQSKLAAVTDCQSCA